jgi:hypothetical protein
VAYGPIQIDTGHGDWTKLKGRIESGSLLGLPDLNLG